MWKREMAHSSVLMKFTDRSLWHAATGGKDYPEGGWSGASLAERTFLPAP